MLWLLVVFLPNFINAAGFDDPTQRILGYLQQMGNNADRYRHRQDLTNSTPTANIIDGGATASPTPINVPMQPVEPVTSKKPQWYVGPLPLASTAPPSFGNGPLVQTLTVGHMVRLANGQFMGKSTVTLVQDEGKNVLVDTGLSTDTFELVKGLANYGLSPDDIDYVVVTHGHPDHVGNLNFFSHKVILYDFFEQLEDRFQETSLKKAPYRRLTQNTEVWRTPGHTNQDITVVVKGYQGNNTVAIVGDLIMNEEAMRQPLGYEVETSYNQGLQMENVNAVVCVSDFIVPGHGPMFWVRPEYRVMAKCDAKTIQKFGIPPFRRDEPIPQY